MVTKHNAEQGEDGPPLLAKLIYWAFLAVMFGPLLAAIVALANGWFGACGQLIGIQALCWIAAGFLGRGRIR